MLTLILAICISYVSAGPTAVGLCYTACNAAVVTCYSASGLTFGAAGPVGWYAWLTSAAALCSTAQGACMATCAATMFAPTP